MSTRYHMLCASVAQSTHMKLKTRKGYSVSPWAERPWPVCRVELATADTAKLAADMSDGVRESLRAALAGVGGVFVPLDEQPVRTWNLATRDDRAEAFV